MAAMTSAFDIRSVAGWFRLIAFAEAVSWAGLLVGMYFKYLGSPQTEIGVKVFGPVHGGDLRRLRRRRPCWSESPTDGGPAHGCWRCWAASCRWAV